MKADFEISYNKVRIGNGKRMIRAVAEINGKTYEVICLTKKLCITNLKKQIL